MNREPIQLLRPIQIATQLQVNVYTEGQTGTRGFSKISLIVASLR